MVLKYTSEDSELMRNKFLETQTVLAGWESQNYSSGETQQELGGLRTTVLE